MSPHKLKLVDVHAHLCEPCYQENMPLLIKELISHEVKAVVVNGLDPHSNRRTLELAQTYPILKAAAGIYPVRSVHHLIPQDHELRSHDFSISEALGEIEDWAQTKKIIAIGECGMDGYWFPETLEEQQNVFSRLIVLAKKYDLPLIVHSRKCEKRVMEVLAQHRAPKVLFHCYMGKVRAALQGAREQGWFFSIPAISPRHQGFSKMLLELPEELLLTETDSPYLAPTPGQRNDPRQVRVTVEHLAKLKDWPLEQTSELIWHNYRRLFFEDS